MKQPTALLLAIASIIIPDISHADPEVAPFAGVKSLVDSKDSRTAWFEQARFGMFIHWGLYSTAGGYWPPDPETGNKYEQHYAEWIKVWAKVPEPEYGELTKPRFTPEEGIITSWAELARDAGMKYAVLTTKHHDGYTLFNSKAPYSSKNPITGSTNISPKNRDLVAEYTEAFRDVGLVPGFYYSLIDWQHPNPETYQQYLHQHLDELASNYGKVGLLWVDFSSAKTQGSHWSTRTILENWHAKQPTAIFNNRFWNNLENDFGDFFTPEKYIPPTGYPDRLFEVCHTMNESFGFSYHDENWKSAREILDMLSDIVSKGGNLLLNVGPDRFGRIPEPSAKALREVGQWLKHHGDAIYGTSASPFTRTPFEGRCTVGEKNGTHTLYLHLYQWPDNGRIHLQGLTTQITNARLLGPTPHSLAFDSEDTPTIKLPTNPPADVLLPVVAVTLKGPPVTDELPYVTQSSDQSVVINARDALVHSTTGKPNIREEIVDSRPHLGYWTKADDSVWMMFFAIQPHQIVHTGGTAEKRPGTYEIIAEYACADNAGGQLELRLLDQTVTANVSTTGGWTQFETRPLGTLTLAQPGLHAIHLRPIAIQNQALMNLRTITLRPVD